MLLSQVFGFEMQAAKPEFSNKSTLSLKKKTKKLINKQKILTILEQF